MNRQMGVEIPQLNPGFFGRSFYYIDDFTNFTRIPPSIRHLHHGRQVTKLKEKRLRTQALQKSGYFVRFSLFIAQTVRWG